MSLFNSEKDRSDAARSTCNHLCVSYNEKYDARYCTNCYTWMEVDCGDKDCCYCPGRPPTALYK